MPRAGAQTLVLLGSPRNCLVLRALAGGPRRQVDLRRAAGSPAQTTMRAHLRALEKLRAIVKRRRSAFPGANEYELEQPGQELLFVLNTLDRWLSNAPEDPLALGSEAAKAATNAFVEGWSSTILRVLAARPHSLTELDRIVGNLSYPSLERRLTAMRLCGQIEPLPADGKGTPYGVTAWLRRGVGPLMAAARWERRNRPVETTPMAPLDVEAVLLLAMPLLRLSPVVSGTCRLTIELPGQSEQHMSGVTVAVEHGLVVSCTTRVHDGDGAWAAGSLGSWFRAVIEADTDHLELGGNTRLARALLEGLFEALFGAGARRRSQAKLATT